MAKKIAKAGDFIEITARKVSDKVQPIFKVGGVYHVNRVEKLKSGAAVLVIDKDIKKGTTIRCNEERFSWKVISPEELQERQFKEQCKADTEELMKHFDLADHKQIAFVPLIIGEVAWAYAEKVLRYCADHRIEAVKKLGRAVKALRERYVSELRKDLDYEHLKGMFDQSQEFIQVHANDFTIMRCSTQNEINRQHIQIPHDEMRTNAYIAYQLCRQLRKHEDKMTELIRQKLGQAKEGHLPCISELQLCMSEYIGSYKIEETQPIKTCMAVFMRNVSQIEFTIV